MSTSGDRPHRWAATTTGLVAALAALAAVAGCSVEQTQPTPRCDEAAVILVAQSLPDASFVPCLGEVPARWETTSVRIDQSGVRVVLDPVAGDVGRVTIEFRADCAVADAVERPSPDDGVQRFEASADSLTGWYVFEGGCAMVATSGDDAARSRGVLAESLQFLDRAALERDLRESFVDEAL